MNSIASKWRNAAVGLAIFTGAAIVGLLALVGPIALSYGGPDNAVVLFFTPLLAMGLAVGMLCVLTALACAKARSLSHPDSSTRRMMTRLMVVAVSVGAASFAGYWVFANHLTP